MKTPRPSQTRYFFLTFALLSIVSVAVSAPTPTPTAALIGNGKIAFTTNRDFNNEIYVMDANGANPTRLTNNNAFEGTPAWSPDGTTIAFTSDRASSREIYVMDADGANPTRLTFQSGTNENPAWSPNGTKIAFQSNRDGSGVEIYVMDINGANQNRLTHDASFDSSPAWSPDGTKIAYSSFRDGNSEIYVMDANGANPTRLTNELAADDAPSWSPDGTKIAFQSRRGSNDLHIWVMDANGANPTLLAPGLSGESLPAWSPDGTKIIFRSGGDIFVMDANGAHPTLLTNTVGPDDTEPDWQRIFGGPTPFPTASPTPTASPFPTSTPASTASPTPTATPPPPGSCAAWTMATLYPLPISGEAVNSVGNFLYSFGGTTTGNVAVVNSYKFDGTTWTPVTPLPAPLAGAVAVTDGTKIYIVGGSILYQYSPSLNTYATLASPTTAAGAAAYLAGKIYKFGNGALEIYDITLNQWTAGANYPLAAFNVRGFAYGNFIYGAGGTTSFPAPLETSATYRYDPATNTWDNAAIADLPDMRAGGAVGIYNGGAVYAGGTLIGMTYISVYSWNPTFNTWVSLPNMLGGLTNMSGAALNGSFYVIGGSDLGDPKNINQRLICTPASTPTPTPIPTATSSPTPSPSTTPSATPGPSVTATPTSTPAPTPTPTPTPAAQPLNLSTRMRVQTGDNVGIGGFIISGTASKHVLVRAIGPSLTQFGIPNALPDPILELHGAGGFVTVTNNNWRDDPTQEALILASGLAPSNDLESAIDATLPPGNYTAVVRGNNNATGVAVIEAYDLNQTAPSKLANISTRAFVSTGDDIVIAGFILGNQSGNDRIVVRGIGPSLSQLGVPDALADPTLELRDNNGNLIIANNDWQDNAAQAAELTAAGLAPSNPLESGIAMTLPPGPYTALLAGRNGAIGNGVVEVYDRGAP